MMVLKPEINPYERVWTSTNEGEEIFEVHKRIELPFEHICKKHDAGSISTPSTHPRPLRDSAPNVPQSGSRIRPPLRAPFHVHIYAPIVHTYMHVHICTLTCIYI